MPKYGILDLMSSFKKVFVSLIFFSLLNFFVLSPFPLPFFHFRSNRHERIWGPCWFFHFRMWPSRRPWTGLGGQSRVQRPNSQEAAVHRFRPLYSIVSETEPRPIYRRSQQRRAKAKRRARSHSYLNREIYTRVTRHCRHLELLFSACAT